MRTKWGGKAACDVLWRRFWAVASTLMLPSRLPPLIRHLTMLAQIPRHVFVDMFCFLLFWTKIKVGAQGLGWCVMRIHQAGGLKVTATLAFTQVVCWGIHKHAKKHCKRASEWQAKMLDSVHVPLPPASCSTLAGNGVTASPIHLPHPTIVQRNTFCLSLNGKHLFQWYYIKNDGIHTQHSFHWQQKYVLYKPLRCVGLPSIPSKVFTQGQ